MRRLLALCAVLAGCDQVFQLERPPMDGSRMDGPQIDAPLACPELFGGNRYFHVPFSEDWSVADARCRALDTVNDSTFTHLAVIASFNEVVEISAQLLPDEQVWVGLTDRKITPPTATPDAFAWITDELPPTTVVPWGSSEPNSTSTPPRCGTIYRLGIDDSGCETTPHPYVCECDAFPEDPSN